MNLDADADGEGTSSQRDRPFITIFWAQLLLQFRVCLPCFSSCSTTSPTRPSVLHNDRSDEILAIVLRPHCYTRCSQMAPAFRFHLHFLTGHHLENNHHILWINRTLVVMYSLLGSDRDRDDLEMVKMELASRPCVK